MIEEIVVTAQKRQESLREVPISMSVVGHEFMRDQGIADFRDLSTYTGNASMVTEYSSGDNFAGGPNIRIRGFGTALGFDTFDQPVGMAIDGDSYSRLPLFLGGLFDIDRVEILKGPQGTLFGKNTSAGLVNVTTNSPTDDFTGFVDAKVGDYQSRRYEAALGGPVVRNLVNFRLAALSDERDGWMRNTSNRILLPTAPPPDRISGGHDRKGIRLKLDLPDFLGATINLTDELTETESTGNVSEYVLLDKGADGPVNYFRKYDANADLTARNDVNSLDVPQRFVTRTHRFVATTTYDFADWRLNGLLGVANFRVGSISDGDGMPAPINIIHNSTRQPQTNVELRVSSPSLGGFLGLPRIFAAPLGSSEFTIGLFYQRRQFAYFNDWLGSPEKIGEYAEVLATGDFPPVPPGSGNPPDPATMMERPTIFAERGTSIAGFGQLTWHALDRWKLDFGGRFTQESKKGAWDITAHRPQDNGWSPLGFTFFRTSTRISESNFTPRLSLTFDATDDLSVFATRSTGFKSGGLIANPSSNANESIRFKPEHSVSWDVGMKSRLLNGTAVFDATLFWMEMTDFQVQTLQAGTVPGTASYIIRNAGKARSRGLELDTTWLPAELLAIRGSLGLADTKYLAFPYGTCPSDRGDTDGDNIPNACNLAGRSFEFTPRWTATLTPRVRLPLAALPGIARGLGVLSGIEVFGSPTIQYLDTYKANRALDGRGRQPAFFKLNANLGFGNPGQGWSLVVGGQNLTNEYTLDDAFFNMPHAVKWHPAPPRMISGGFRWEF